MLFSPHSTFTINPDVLFVIKDSTIHLTFSSLDTGIMEINHFAREVFLMAVNEFPYSELQAVSSEVFKDNPAGKEKLDAFLNDLIKKEIFSLNV